MRTANRKKSSDTYFQLIHAFPLRRLKTAREHGKAKRLYLKLSSSKGDPGTRDYLDVLADLIADYEKRAQLTVDTWNTTAAELVRHRLAERGMSVSALSREIGIPQPNLSEMLSGRRDWSKAAIRSLSQLFSIRAERFLA